MEPTKTKMNVQIGQFKVIDVKPGAIRIALGQGVNVWIHINFEHSATTDDMITLLAEIPYAYTRPASEQ